MKHVKIVAPAWAGYNGHFGRYEFKDGVSVNPLSQLDRDRLSTAVKIVELDDDGGETPSGIATRLVDDRAMRAPVLAPLQRQTEKEKKEELLRTALNADHPPTQLRT